MEPPNLYWLPPYGYEYGYEPSVPPGYYGAPVVVSSSGAPLPPVQAGSGPPAQAPSSYQPTYPMYADYSNAMYPPLGAMALTAEDYGLPPDALFAYGKMPLPPPTSFSMDVRSVETVQQLRMVLNDYGPGLELQELEGALRLTARFGDASLAESALQHLNHAVVNDELVLCQLRDPRLDAPLYGLPAPLVASHPSLPVFSTLSKHGAPPPGGEGPPFLDEFGAVYGVVPAGSPPPPSAPSASAASQKLSSSSSAPAPSSPLLTSLALPSLNAPPPPPSSSLPSASSSSSAQPGSSNASAAAGAGSPLAVPSLYYAPPGPFASVGDGMGGLFYAYDLPLPSGAISLMYPMAMTMAPMAPPRSSSSSSPPPPPQPSSSAHLNSTAASSSSSSPTLLPSSAPPPSALPPPMMSMPSSAAATSPVRGPMGSRRSGAPSSAGPSDAGPSSSSPPSLSASALAAGNSSSASSAAAQTTASAASASFSSSTSPSSSSGPVPMSPIKPPSRGGALPASPSSFPPLSLPSAQAPGSPGLGGLSGLGVPQVGYAPAANYWLQSGYPSRSSGRSKGGSGGAGSGGVGVGVGSSDASFGSMTASGRIRTSHGEVDQKTYSIDLDRIRSRQDSRTTLMIKNIPNKYSQEMVLKEIDVHHQGKYDFFYLPIDFKNKCNVGYAFINFINYSDILDFFDEFNNRKWNRFNSEKICEVRYGRIQGKQSLIIHFKNSSVMTVDEQYRPLLFFSNGPNQGLPEEFPDQ